MKNMINLDGLVGNGILNWLTEAGVTGCRVFFGLILFTILFLIWFFVLRDECYSLIKGDEGYYVVSPEGNRTDEFILVVALAQWVWYNTIPYVIGVIAGVAFILYARIYPSPF